MQHTCPIFFMFVFWRKQQKNVHPCCCSYLKFDKIFLEHYQHFQPSFYIPLHFYRTATYVLGQTSSFQMALNFSFHIWNTLVGYFSSTLLVFPTTYENQLQLVQVWVQDLQMNLTPRKCESLKIIHYYWQAGGQFKARLVM